jgi:UTP-glucose-1-phosphate uridylyltransferase
MPPPALIIMAAGLGSRYGRLKPVAPVGPHGEAAVAYSVHDALKAGFGRIVFVTRRAMQAAFRERVGRAVEKIADTAYVSQELDRLPALPVGRQAGFRVPPGRKKPWGTGHAILCCKGVVRTPFAAINADDFYGPTSYAALAGHLKAASSYCMVGFVLKNTLSRHGTVARGICEVTRDGFLVSVTERTQVRRAGDRVQYADEKGRWVEIPGRTIVSMNMWGFTPDIFGELQRRFAAFLETSGADPGAEYYIPSVVAELVREGKARVRVLRSEETWFGLTYPEDLPAAQQAVRELIRRGVYPERLVP